MMIPKQIENSGDVPGFNNKQHLDALEKYASKIPEGSKVLEIGVGWGGSTWSLLDSLPKGCELYSCDTFAMNDIQLKQHHCNGVLKKHSHNSAIVYAMDLYMKRDQRACFDWCVGQHPRYKTTLKGVFQERSLDVLERDNVWDLVYLDGWHQYENVKRELNLLANTKYICGDDYHPVHPGCKQAIDEFIQSNPDRDFWFDTFESGSGFWTSTKNA